MSELYELIRKEQRMWCQGKKERALRATCEYVELMLKGKGVSMKVLSRKYKVSESVIGRYWPIIFSFVKLTDLQKRIFDAQAESKASQVS